MLTSRFALLQEEAVATASPSSSSGMISFELTNGQPFGPHVPIAIDDDQYVEYSLDNMAEFPRDMEEEERVGPSYYIYTYIWLTFLFVLFDLLLWYCLN